MSTINKKAKSPRSVTKHVAKREKLAHKNYMDGYSYKVGDPIYNLRLAASSCFFGEPSYYVPSKGEAVKPSAFARNLPVAVADHLNKVLNRTDPQSWRGLSTAQAMEKAIDEALEFNAEATLLEAVRLRNEENIRVTPQVILVRAANSVHTKGTNLIRKHAKEIIKRADEPATCTAYHLSAFPGKTMPSSLKRAIADSLACFTEYELAKYRMENRDVKTVDVVNLVHPKSTEAISKLVKGELKLGGDNETWEQLRSGGASWGDCVAVMGHMALLRNLRNFVEARLEPSIYLDKLVSTAKNGKQLPFRYYTAYRELEKVAAPGVVLDAIENCLVASLDNLPRFEGRVMSLTDNSGSARGQTTSSLGSTRVCDIGNLTAVLTAKVSTDGHVGVFGDRLEALSVRKNSSIFDDLKKVESLGEKIGHGTENGIWLFWRDAIAKREHWDNVFIYSDQQAGHGGLYGVNPSEYRNYTCEYRNYTWITAASRYIDVPMLINEYRKQVNPLVNVFSVQTAGYQDNIMPEYYDRTYLLGGWGDGLLKFASSMINGNNAQC